MVKLTCQECVAPKRYPGCHDKCEEYQAWKKEHDALKEKIKKERWLKSLGK